MKSIRIKTLLILIIFSFSMSDDQCGGFDKNYCKAWACVGGTFVGVGSFVSLIMLATQSSSTPTPYTLPEPDQLRLPSDPCYAITLKQCTSTQCSFDGIQPTCSLFNSNNPNITTACPSVSQWIFDDATSWCTQHNVTKCYSDSVIPPIISKLCKQSSESISNTTKPTQDDVRTRFKARKKQLQDKRRSKK
jgi:hypothetical protein